MVSLLAEQHEPAQVETYSNRESSYRNQSFHNSFQQSFRASSDPNMLLLDDDSENEGRRVYSNSRRSSRDVAEPAAISTPFMRKTVSCSIMSCGGQPRDSLPRPCMRKPSIRSSNTSSNYQWDNSNNNHRRISYDSLPRPGTRRQSSTVRSSINGNNSNSLVDPLEQLALDSIPRPSTRRASLHASSSSGLHDEDCHHHHRPTSMGRTNSADKEQYDSLRRPGIHRDSRRMFDRQPVSPTRRESLRLCPNNTRMYHNPRQSSQTSVIDVPSTIQRPTFQRTASITIDVQPGLSLPLRGKDETLSAIANNFCTQVHCMACTMELTCIANAEYVLCPVCKSISPIERNSSSNNNNNCGPSFGVGLGSTEVY